MEKDSQTQLPDRSDASPHSGVLRQPRSHTQDNPVAAPHTKAGLSTISTPEPYIRIFLLAWAVRYIPRGLIGEAFDARTFRPIKRAMDWVIERGFLNRHVANIEAKMAKNAELVLAEQKALSSNGHAKHEVASALYEDMRKVVRRWRGNASDQIPAFLKDAKANAAGGFTLGESSRGMLRKTIRGRLDDMLYSLSLFAGSTWLTFNYSKNVRTDIENVFRETVALEKNIPEQKVTFADIANSDNQIIRHTVENYRSKRRGRLLNDSLFLVTAGLKSMPLTDAVLGFHGLQMFRDTQRRHPTVFEDIVTFVNNKINPVNGLGQPIAIGEVFDLYQHYAQAYAPEKAFVGVIEHAKSEGARWADNQIIFQRMTELLNKTYAYKHKSITNSDTGLTVLQADFPLPKFIYLLGHDLIDVNAPQKTLATIEIANSYGIDAVQDMQNMLRAGKTLEEVQTRYPVVLPTPQTAPAPHEVNDVNTVVPKGATLQMDAVEQATTTHRPTAKIDVRTLHEHGMAGVQPNLATSI